MRSTGTVSGPAGVDDCPSRLGTEPVSGDRGPAGGVLGFTRGLPRVADSRPVGRIELPRPPVDPGNLPGSSVSTTRTDTQVEVGGRPQTTYPGGVDPLPSLFRILRGPAKTGPVPVPDSLRSDPSPPTPPPTRLGSRRGPISVSTRVLQPSRGPSRPPWSLTEDPVRLPRHSHPCPSFSHTYGPGRG